MKKLIQSGMLLLAIFFLATVKTMSQDATGVNQLKTVNTKEMKTYLIEREIPNAGKLSPEELKAISQTSCGVLKEMGPKIQWINSYVTANKIYCIYKAESVELIKEHAKKGGFPANTIVEV